mgnify:FL=1
MRQNRGQIYFALGNKSVLDFLVASPFLFAAGTEREALAGKSALAEEADGN